MAVRKPGFGLPTKPFDPMFGLPSNPSAPDFFAPLANSPQLQAMRPTFGAPPGGGGGGGSGYSDYQNALRAQLAAAGEADAANRRSNIQQALIAFGMVPEGMSDPYGDIDARTRDLIGKNTSSGISTFARLNQGRDDSRKALLNRLGARGLFRSGAKGYGLRRGQLDYDRSLADSLAQLMQTVGGFNSAFANNELNRQQQLASMMSNAYGNYVPPSSFGSSGFAGRTSAFANNPFIRSLRGGVTGGVRSAPVPYAPGGGGGGGSSYRAQ